EHHTARDGKCGERFPVPKSLHPCLPSFLCISVEADARHRSPSVCSPASPRWSADAAGSRGRPPPRGLLGGDNGGRVSLRAVGRGRPRRSRRYRRQLMTNYRRRAVMIVCAVVGSCGLLIVSSGAAGTRRALDGPQTCAGVVAGSNQATPTPGNPCWVEVTPYPFGA